MKKTLAILLALCMLFAFAACGGGAGSKSSEKLLGTWTLYNGDSTAVKATLVINDDGTGVYTTSIDARDTAKTFTYTDNSGVLELSFEDGTSAQWSYTLEEGKLTVGNNTFVKPAQ